MQNRTNVKCSIHVECARNFELTCFLLKINLIVDLKLKLLLIVDLKYKVMRC